MRPEYKGTPKFCREPDGVQLGMRAFSHALVIKSAPVHKDSGCQGSGHSCQAQHLPHGSLLTTPPPGLSPLHGTFAPVLSKAGMQAHPVISFLCRFGSDQTCEDSAEFSGCQPSLH